MHTLLESMEGKREEQRRLAISKLGIFELRGLARELGVHSPTTHKRDELVSLIMEMFDNGAPLTPINRKGRPAKTLSNMEEIMTKMTNIEEKNSFATPTRRIRPYEEIVTFSQDTPVFSMLANEVTAKFEGVLRVTVKVGYFLDVNTGIKVFVPKDMIRSKRLDVGDYIYADCKKINIADQYVVTKLLQINFKDASKVESIDINNDRKPIINYQTLDYGQFKLNRGRRNLIKYKTNVFEDDRFVNFANNLVKDNYRVVILSLNTIFEDEIIFNQVDGAIKMITKYGEHKRDTLDKVVDTISLVGRLANCGEKVVLFVNDIVEVLNALEICFEKKELVMEHSAEAVVILQKLVSLSKAFNDGSEATIVMTFREYNEGDSFLINEVFKISTKFE